jgi:hypothetical protein
MASHFLPRSRKTEGFLLTCSTEAGQSLLALIPFVLVVQGRSRLGFQDGRAVVD